MGKNNEPMFGNILDMQSDEAAERDGVDVAFGNGRFITVKRSGSTNREYRSTMAKVFSPHQKPGGAVSLSDDAARNLLKEVYAESIVVGWSGFKDGNKKDIPYNKENCVALFTEAPELFEIIQSEAAKFSNFAREDVDDSGK